MGRRPMGIHAILQNACMYSVHRKKALYDIPVPSRDVTYQTLPPIQSLVSDILAGDGNIEKLFLRCSTSIAANMSESPNSMKKLPRAASEAASMGRLRVVTVSVSGPADSSGTNHQVFWRR